MQTPCHVVSRCKLGTGMADTRIEVTGMKLGRLQSISTERKESTEAWQRGNVDVSEGSGTLPANTRKEVH